MTPAMVACCSKAGLAVIRALGAQGVPVIGLRFGNAQIGAASRFMRSALAVPDPSDDEQAFVNRLVEIGPRYEGAVLFATDDGSLVAISKHASLLSAFYRVVPQPWSVVGQLIEKHRTYEVARQREIPCPRLIMISTVDECLAFAREVGFPCLLKPSVGHVFFKRFRRKMIMVKSERELLLHMDLIGSERADIMICEYIPGGDECGANYNSFAVSGSAIQEFTARKLRNKPQLIGFPTVVHSTILPQVQTLGRRVLAAFGISDFSCTEFKLDPRDGRYKFMEVNARPNYSGALAAACGINFPLFSYQRALGLPFDCVREQDEGVVWIDEERDVLGLARAAQQGFAAAARYARAYRGRKVFAVFRADDPRPSLVLARSRFELLLRARKAKRTELSNPQALESIHKLAKEE